MAGCKYCKRDMLKTSGCTFTKFELRNRIVVPRQKVGEEDRIKPGKRCGDCGALYGNYHHFGCDMERCPVCGMQAAFCDCIVALRK